MHDAPDLPWRRRRGRHGVPVLRLQGALVNAVYRQWKQHLGQSLFPIPDEGPPRRQFLELWTRLIRFAHLYPSALAFLETHKHAPYLDEGSFAVIEEVDQAARGFSEQLRRGGAPGDLGAHEAAALVFGAFVGLFKTSDEVDAVLDPTLAARAGRAVWWMLEADDLSDNQEAEARS